MKKHSGHAPKTLKIRGFWLVLMLVMTTGCTTASSLGLPSSGGGNKILKSALQISASPGESLLVPKELEKQPLDVYIVEIGDTLLIEPVKFDASIRLPGDQVVKPDGFISLGESGQILAVNKTLEQIQIEAQALINSRLKQDLEVELEIERRQRVAEAEEGPVSAEAKRESRVALERRYNQSVLQNKVSVRLINWDSKKVYVLGEVNSPGSFTFTGHQTVLDAIIEAGGMTSKANHHQVIVARPSSCGSCRTVMQVCYDQIVQLGDASTNYQLQPGDRVFVPSLTFVEDLKRSFHRSKSDRCPRCGPSPQGCALPTGCNRGY